MKRLGKTLVAVFTAAVLLLSVVCSVVSADSAIAKVGETPYSTIAEAIEAVEDGGTIQLLPGEISAKVETGRIDKSFTIIGAENYGTIITAGLQIGTDNSSWGVQDYTVAVKGILFKNKSLSVCDIRNVVVEDNKFEDIDENEPAAIRIVDQSIDGVKASAVVKNNYIDTSSQGIRIRTGHDVEIIGNTVKNTQHNSVTLEHASKWPANAGTVKIAENVFENWGLGGEGRVVRGSFASAQELSKEISFTGNKMLRKEEPAEEYLKFTGVGTVAVDFEKNYWNSTAPDFETIITVEGGNTEVAIEEYYKAETMKAEELNTYSDWVMENSNWIYYEQGELVKGWKQLDGWYWFDQAGIMQTGWEKIDGVWYYMDSYGRMQTGWEQIGTTWYYFDIYGAMQTGWERIGSTWYYLDANGAMQTGWELIDGKWYYMDIYGAMQTGWESIDGKWYYMDIYGAMQTGWLKLGDTWYYLEDSGAMVTGRVRIDGKLYRFNKYGAWIS